MEHLLPPIIFGSAAGLGIYGLYLRVRPYFIRRKYENLSEEIAAEARHNLAPETNPRHYFK
jgi:hypothetical protein